MQRHISCLIWEKVKEKKYIAQSKKICHAPKPLFDTYLFSVSHLAGHLSIFQLN